MKSFKGFLTEQPTILKEAAGPTGAQWESIITHQLNKLIGKENADPDAVEVSNRFSDFQEKGKLIAQNFQSKFGNSLMTQYGGGGGVDNLSASWISRGGTNGTPKTDMYTSDYNVSLKKKGGSQLASGGTGESIATFYAALEYLGKDKKSLSQISKIMDDIEQNFTKIMLNYSKTEIEKISKGEKDADLSPDEKKEIEKFTETEKFHKEINETMKDVLNFGANPEFMKWYVFEAMSGLKKFKNKLAVASVCVTFDADKGGITTIPVTSNGKSSGLKGDTPTISSELIKKAKSVKVYTAWKSSKGKPYSTVRMNSYNPTTIDTIPLIDCTLDSIIRDELQNDRMANQVHRTLNEDLVVLDEFAIIRKVVGKIKSIGKSALNWLKGFVGRVLTKVKAAFAKIKKLGEKMYHGLLNFMGIEVSSVNEKVPSDLQGFVYGTAD